MGERPVVLVVENSSCAADRTVEYINQSARERFAVRSAENVEAALTILAAGAVDAVVLTLNLPDSSELTRLLRIKAAAPDAAVIVLSSVVTDRIRSEAIESGAEDVFAKDEAFTPLFLRSVHYVIERNRAVRRQREVEGLLTTVRAAEGRTREQAERFASLWRISNEVGAHGDEHMQAMLREAGSAIRPQQHFRVYLSRIGRTTIHILAAGQPVVPGDGPAVVPGSRVPIEYSMVHRFDRTFYIDDLTTLPELPRAFVGLAIRALIVTKFKVDGHRYLLTLMSPELPRRSFDEDDAAYIELLAASFAKLLQVQQLERQLRAEEAYARRHAERLEGLLALVNDVSRSDDDLWLVMLEHAAATILPGQGYRGFLSRVEGSDLILEVAVATDDGAVEEPGGNKTIQPLSGTLSGALLMGGARTQSWDDLSATREMATELEAGWRSGIATTFTAGGSVWTVSFLSREPARRPFGLQERNYIELLASFFANRVQQTWQHERLQHQQSHDILTGLLNRSQFRSKARLAASFDPHFAIVLFDLSDFREINEAYGHMTGDALLVEVGTALQRCAANDEIVGRVGGDVFGIYVPHVTSRQIIRRRALTFSEIFTKPFSTGDREGKEFIALTASAGIAIATDTDRVDTVMSHADAALVATKRRGQGSLLFYEPGMEGSAHVNATLRNELTIAVIEDQFVLYFQPHIDLRTGEVLGCEALLRWQHPERGLLLPGTFVPFAERSGIIASIDAWVMQRAFEAAADLRMLIPKFRLYFNLSGRQAGSPEVVRAFVDAAHTGAPLHNVGVEITETDAMRDIAETRRVCHALRNLGVRIAIDDFGTGYSSLSSLKQLPIDIVKIDQSFVAGIPSDPHDTAIAETIISISKRFGFESLAEGAETPEQIAWLRNASCGYAQGYGISHPLPMAAFKRWLADYKAGRPAAS